MKLTLTTLCQEITFSSSPHHMKRDGSCPQPKNAQKMHLTWQTDTHVRRNIFKSSGDKTKVCKQLTQTQELFFLIQNLGPALATIESRVLTCVTNGEIIFLPKDHITYMTYFIWKVKHTTISGWWKNSCRPAASQWYFLRVESLCDMSLLITIRLMYLPKVSGNKSSLSPDVLPGLIPSEKKRPPFFVPTNIAWDPKCYWAHPIFSCLKKCAKRNTDYANCKNYSKWRFFKKKLVKWINS